MSNFLYKLGPGDYVVLRTGYDLKRQLVKVDRVTKTQVILENGFRISKKTGKIIKAFGWYKPIIEEATQEIIEEIKRERYKKRLLEFIEENVQQADLATLELMAQAVTHPHHTISMEGACRGEAGKPWQASGIAGGEWP